jgi:hypothetical protein
MVHTVRETCGPGNGTWNALRRPAIIGALEAMPNARRSVLCR